MCFLGLRYKKTVLSYKDTRFRVLVADSFGKKVRGLMGRESLARDEGMLFVFDSEKQYGIWMLGMRFPIDIVWLNKQGRVVDMIRSATPCSSLLNCPVYKPRNNARYVLELKDGTAYRYGIRLGSKFEFGSMPKD